MSPRWLHWPAADSLARYTVSGDLGTYSPVRFAIDNPVESGSDAGWWSRYPYGEFRKDSDSLLQWILLRDAVGNPYANVAAFVADFTLDSASIIVNGSPVTFSSVSWIDAGTNNLQLNFSGSGYNALWSTFSVGDPVSLSISYS